jgi:hypothetical protein
VLESVASASFDDGEEGADVFPSSSAVSSSFAAYPPPVRDMDVGGELKDIESYKDSYSSTVTLLYTRHQISSFFQNRHNYFKK